MRPAIPILARLGLVSLLFAACGGDDPAGPGGSNNIPANTALVSGESQIAEAGTKLPAPLVVRVTNTAGAPVNGVTVTWAVESGGGSLSAATTATDAQGHTQVEWTLGTTAGEYRATATAGLVTPLTFTATARPGAPVRLEKLRGDAQTGRIGAPLADSLAVQAFDAHGNVVPERPVTWSVTAGGGAVSASTGNTDVSGIMRTRWTLGATPGTQRVTATVGSLNAAFTATADP